MSGSSKSLQVANSAIYDSAWKVPHINRYASSSLELPILALQYLNYNHPLPLLFNHLIFQSYHPSKERHLQYGSELPRIAPPSALGTQSERKEQC